MKRGTSLGLFFFATILSFSTLSYSSISEPQPFCPATNFKKAITPGYMQDIAETDIHSRLNLDNLKLLVWNIYKGGKPGVYTDIDILTQNVDLALFQEGYLGQTFATLICSRDNLNWKMAKSFADRHGNYSGVVTAGHQNPIQSYALISPNTEPFSDIHKMMLVNLYSIPGRIGNLMVINLHGINFVPQSYYENQINVLVNVIKDHHGPVILAGDFNSYTTGRTEYLLKTMKSLGLKHAKISGNEYDGLFVLDHLFYRGFEVTKAETLKNVSTSDHKPLYFELHLLGNQQ